MIKNIMGDAQPVADSACIADVLARTATANPVDRRAMIIKLQRDPDGFRPRPRGEGSDDRRVHAARHRDHDAAGLGRTVKLKKVKHRPRT